MGQNTRPHIRALKRVIREASGFPSGSNASLADAVAFPSLRGPAGMVARRALWPSWTNRCSLTPQLGVKASGVQLYYRPKHFEFPILSTKRVEGHRAFDTPEKTTRPKSRTLKTLDWPTELACGNWPALPWFEH